MVIMRRVLLALLVGGCLAMVGCPRSDTPAPVPVPTQGCSPTTTDELYVQHAYACSDGTMVLTFSDVTARDEYVQVAEHYGVIIMQKGDAWVRIKRNAE